MSLTDASISLLSQTSTTFTPDEGLLNIGEMYVNVADATLWTGTQTGSALEIGLNSKTGLLSETGKYLNRDASPDQNDLGQINIPYDPQNLRTDEYFEFFIMFTVGGNTPTGSYSQNINWGSIPDPLPSLSSGQSLYVKLFAYGFSGEWFAIPVWSDDTALNLFNGSDAKFSYTEVQAPSGLVMPRRSRLRFQGLTTATVSDDLANDATIVELGRELVTRIDAQPSVQLNYNLSEYYVLTATTSLDLPGLASPTDPFEFVVQNAGMVDMTINQGSLGTLLAGDTALIIYDGQDYRHVVFNGSGGGTVASTLTVSDEGTAISVATESLNFTGSAVTVTSSTPNNLVVDIQGGGEPYVEIQSAAALPSSTLSTETINIGSNVVSSGSELVSLGLGNSIGSLNAANDDILKVVQLGIDNVYYELFQGGSLGEVVQIGINNTHDGSAWNNVQIGIGNSTAASLSTVVIGNGSSIGNNSDNSVAIGDGAVVMGGNYDCVQLGTGTNSSAYTIQFRSTPVANDNSLLTGFITPTNYTPAVSTEIDDHLEAIDTALGNAGGGGGSALEVEDEGVSLSTAVTKFNFAGTGVTVTEPVADEVLVTIAGEPYVEISSSGTLPNAATLNSLAIGPSTDVSGDASNSISLGISATNNSSTSSIVIGSNSSIVDDLSNSIAIGYGVNISDPNGLAGFGSFNNTSLGSYSNLNGSYNATAIGTNTTVFYGNSSVALGDRASVTGVTADNQSSSACVAIGLASSILGGQSSVAIGSFAESQGSLEGVAIGASAVVSANNAIQLGQGTNNTSSSLKFRDEIIANGANGLQAKVFAGAPTTLGADGSLAVDTTNDAFYIRSQSAWVEVGAGSGGSALEVEDEGVSLSTAVTKFNFAGAGVTVTEPTSDEVLVTIPSGGNPYLEVNSSGTFADAQGDDSIAIGESALANGFGVNSARSVIIGFQSVVSGRDAVTIGSNVTGSAIRSVTVGAQSFSASSNSIAIGFNSSSGTLNTGSIAIGDGSVIGGNNNANAIALGVSAAASAINAIQLGSGGNSVANTLQYLTVPVANNNSLLTGFTAPTSYTLAAPTEIDSHLAAIDSLINVTAVADVSSNFSLNASLDRKIIPIDTTGGDVTISLVGGLSNGFNCVLYNLGSNSVIINVNGQTLRSAGLTISNSNASASLLYDSNNTVWYAVGDIV